MVGIHKIEAPFTPEQVAGMKEFQGCDRVHPFTCPGGPDCPDRKLVPTKSGWVCACGDYKQNWAHSFMARGAPPECEATKAFAARLPR